MNILTYVLSKNYTDKQIEEAKREGFRVQVEQDRSVLETTGQEKVFYFLPKTSENTSDGYDEFVYANGAWEQVGVTDVDLSDYYTKTAIDNMVDDTLSLHIALPKQEVSDNGVSGYTTVSFINGSPDGSQYTVGETMQLPVAESGLFTRAYNAAHDNAFDTYQTLGGKIFCRMHTRIVVLDRVNWPATPWYRQIPPDISVKADKATTLSGYGITDAYTKTEIDNKGYLTQHQDISGKEDVANKVTEVTENSTDEQYPTAKAVYDIVQNAVPQTVDLSSAAVMLSANGFTYDGTSKAPSVTSVVLNGQTLTEGTDYVVVSVPATNAGSYSLTVNGIGGYSGTVTKNWSIYKAQATITGDSSVTISGTAEPVAKTYTTDGDGTFSFSITGNIASVSNSGGTVTITPSALGSATMTVAVTGGANYIGATKNVSVEIVEAADVFGVCWDYSLGSPALARLTPQNDPLGVVTHFPTTEPTACVGSTGGQSEFDNFMPWLGMVRKNYVNGQLVDFTGYDNGETYVYIPPFWSKIVDDTANSKMYFYIASTELTGFTRHQGSGRYIGRYQCDVDFLSKPNGAPKSGVNLAGFRSGITSVDGNHFQYDFHSYNALLMLYIVEFANLDSQSAIGAGITSGTTQTLGQTDILTYHTGRAGGTDNTSAVQYRWIENLWGNIWEYSDGILIDDYKIFLCGDPSKYASTVTNDYADTGIVVTDSSHIKYITREYSYHNGYLFPKLIDGTSSTYVCDAYFHGSGLKCLMVGGRSTSGADAGLFFWNGDTAPDTVSQNVSSRPILIINGGTA